MLEETVALTAFLDSSWSLFSLAEGCKREYLFGDSKFAKESALFDKAFSGPEEVSTRKTSNGVRWMLNLFHLHTICSGEDNNNDFMFVNPCNEDPTSRYS